MTRYNIFKADFWRSGGNIKKIWCRLGQVFSSFFKLSVISLNFANDYSIKIPRYPDINYSDVWDIRYPGISWYKLLWWLGYPRGGRTPTTFSHASQIFIIVLIYKNSLFYLCSNEGNVKNLFILKEKNGKD